MCAALLLVAGLLGAIETWCDHLRHTLGCGFGVCEGGRQGRPDSILLGYAESYPCDPNVRFGCSGRWGQPAVPFLGRRRVRT